MTIPTYDTDFYAWTQQQAAALRDRKWMILDVEHLAEEIESLGRSERYALESHLQNLLTHLLKWRYDLATELRRGLRIAIRNARRGIAYRDAREDAADETDLSLPKPRQNIVYVSGE